MTSSQNKQQYLHGHYAPICYVDGNPQGGACFAWLRDKENVKKLSYFVVSLLTKEEVENFITTIYSGWKPFQHAITLKGFTKSIEDLKEDFVFNNEMESMDNPFEIEFDCTKISAQAMVSFCTIIRQLQENVNRIKDFNIVHEDVKDPTIAYLVSHFLTVQEEDYIYRHSGHDLLYDYNYKHSKYNRPTLQYDIESLFSELLDQSPAYEYTNYEGINDLFNSFCEINEGKNHLFYASKDMIKAFVADNETFNSFVLNHKFIKLPNGVYKCED